jgi:hypothetical protein
MVDKKAALTAALTEAKSTWLSLRAYYGEADGLEVLVAYPLIERAQKLMTDLEALMAATR